MSGGDGVFFNRQIVGIATDRDEIFIAILSVNFFQVLQKLNICKLGKKLTLAKSLESDFAVSFRKGCDVNTAGLSRDSRNRDLPRFKAESRFWGFGCRVFFYSFKLQKLAFCKFCKKIFRLRGFFCHFCKKMQNPRYYRPFTRTRNR